MRFDEAVKSLGCNIVDLIDGVHVHIDHGAAFIAIEVVMGVGVGIEMIQSVADPDLLKLTEFRKQLEITVYGAQRNIGILLTDA